MCGVCVCVCECVCVFVCIIGSYVAQWVRLWAQVLEVPGLIPDQGFCLGLISFAVCPFPPNKIKCVCV